MIFSLILEVSTVNCWVRDTSELTREECWETTLNKKLLTWPNVICGDEARRSTISKGERSGSEASLSLGSSFEDSLRRLVWRSEKYHKNKKNHKYDLKT